MTIKRTVSVAGVASAALILGSSAFAYANGILGGHRADPVGSYVPVEAEFAVNAELDRPPTSAVARAGETTTGSATANRTPSSDDGAAGPVTAVVPGPGVPVGASQPETPAPVTPPAAHAVAPPTTPAYDDHADDDEYEEHEAEPEHEDEAEVEVDDHGRDDDD